MTDIREKVQPLYHLKSQKYKNEAAPAGAASFVYNVYNAYYWNRFINTLTRIVSIIRPPNTRITGKNHERPDLSCFSSWFSIKLIF